jgi:hypothetical protein
MGACLAMPGGAVLLPPSIRRMTNAEYDASVQALLGTTMTPSAAYNFPPDSRQGGGFTLQRRAAGRPGHGQGARTTRPRRW